MKNGIFGKALIAAAAVAVTTGGFATTVSAQAREARTAIVEYGDLDLTSSHGQAVFQGRVKGAVRKVCGSYDTRDIHEVQDHGRCTDEASLSAKRASVSILAAAAAGKPIATAMVLKR